jgi:hypothetical protein
MPAAFTSKQWVELIDALPETMDMVPGYLNVNQFGERSQATQQYIKEALVQGIIPRAHCLKFRRGTYHTVLINWNKTGYDFIIRRPQARWPADFRRNKERLYRPIPVGDIDIAPLLVAPSVPNNTEVYRDDVADIAASTMSDADIDRIADIGSAKLVAEKLKIKQQAREARIADGSLMSIDEVIAANRDIVFRLRAQLISMTTRLAPVLAAESTPGACRLLLVQGLNEAFETLRDLNRGTTEKTELTLS